MSLLAVGIEFLFADAADVRGILVRDDRLMPNGMIVALIEAQVLRGLWGGLRPPDDDGLPDGR